MCQYSYVYYSYCDHAELTLLEYCSAAVAKAGRLSHADRVQTHDDGQQQHWGRPTDNEPGGASECDTRVQGASQPANTLQQHVISEGSGHDAPGQDASDHFESQDDAFQQQSSVTEEDVGMMKDNNFRIQSVAPGENVQSTPSTLSPAARLAARFQQSEQDPFIEKSAPGLGPKNTPKSPFSYADILKTRSPETTRTFALPKKTTTEGVKQQDRTGPRAPLAITTNLPQQRRSSEPTFDLASPQAFPTLSSKTTTTAPPSAVSSGKSGRSTSWAQVVSLTTSNESSPSSYSGPTAESDAGTVSTSVSTSLTSFPSDITFDPSNPSAERSPQYTQPPFDEAAKMVKDIIIPPITKDPDPAPHSPRKTLPTEWLQDTSGGHPQYSSLHPKKSMGTLRTPEATSHERATSPTKTIAKPFMFATARRAAEREAKVRSSSTSPVKSSSDPSKSVKGKPAKLQPSTMSHSHASSISTTGTVFHTAHASPTHSISTLSFASDTDDHGDIVSALGSPSRIPRLALKLSEILQVELTLSGPVEEPESGINEIHQKVVELVEDSVDHSVTSEGTDTNEPPKLLDVAYSLETAMKNEEITGIRFEAFGPHPQDHTDDDDISVLSTSKTHFQDKSQQSEAEFCTAIDELEASLTTRKPEIDAVSDQAESAQSTQRQARDGNDHVSSQNTFIESNHYAISAAPASTQDPAILYKGHGHKEVFRSAPELLKMLRRRSATLPAKVALTAAAKVALNAEAKEFVPMGIPAESWENSYFNRAPLPAEMIYPGWKLNMPRSDANATDYPAYPAMLSESMQQIIRSPAERPQTWKAKSSASPKKSLRKIWPSKRYKRFVSADSESDGNTITQASYKKWTKKNNGQKRDWNSHWYDGAWKSVNGAPPTFESFYADRAQRIPSDDRSIVTNPYHGRTSSKSSGSTTAGNGPEQNLGHEVIEPCGHWNVTMAGEFGNAACHECLP
ncbi:uncharacterized protein K452DRAFT_321309 [Aplosporella prunicola CBS 121167]|uniref:Uncharacterized protein n=1 Tax=Aplosporella prunicola CBS 121167 TaxID=1176127 RepID=A0A6A6B2T4_9PEZI|nr:uncharacterized protein K452DRAFT_321309 [Aplosporella prunicola CBS 121167]KAF2138360.1 hypothetical protein K452DRAFT_321309 [Aplosporella prunicola CBS 121167]